MVKYGTKAGNYASKMLCPFKLANKRPIKAIAFLCAGLFILLLDCIFSKRSLGFFMDNELMCIAFLAVCGFSALVDIAAIKRSYIYARADILPRFTAITASMLCTAAAILVLSFFNRYTSPVLLVCSALRLLTPSVRKVFVPVIIGAVALLAAFITAKILSGAPGAADAAEAMLKEAFPLCMTAVMKIKDYVLSRW